MKIAPTVPRHGDVYPTVRAWMQRLGATDLDILANSIKMVTRDSIIRAVQDIVGKPYPAVNFRLMHASEGRGGMNYVTFDRGSLEAGTLTFGTVLHEIAHCLMHRKIHASCAARHKRRVEGKPVALGRLTWKEPSHGELFCRVYARLLREELVADQWTVTAAEPKVRLNGIEQVLAELARPKE